MQVCRDDLGDADKPKPGWLRLCWSVPPPPPLPRWAGSAPTLAVVEVEGRGQTTRSTLTQKLIWTSRTLSRPRSASSGQALRDSTLNRQFSPSHKAGNLYRRYTRRRSCIKNVSIRIGSAWKAEK